MILRDGEEWKTERIGILIIIAGLIIIAITMPVAAYACSLLTVLTIIFIVGIYKFFGGSE